MYFSNASVKVCIWLNLLQTRWQLYSSEAIKYESICQSESYFIFHFVVVLSCKLPLAGDKQTNLLPRAIELIRRQ